MDKICLSRYHSPCGSLLLGSVGDRLCLCDWAEDEPRHVVASRLGRLLRVDCENRVTGVTQEAARQLDEYFSGRRRSFDIPLLLVGTEFQMRVWGALQNIGYGETETYAGLAARISSDRAVRAVASANGANAVSLFVPCHRVVGSDGSLTGYAGGLDAKRFLLRLEGSVAARCRV